MEAKDTLVGNRYQIESTLGEGGMATVYRAKDIITGRQVAVKIIKDETIKNPINVQRFEREARTTAALNHPNLVKIITLGTHNGRPYIVNEYISGKTLRDVLDQRGRLSPQEALDAMAQLCSAVLFAHRHGVIHRDIKPQNIFVTPDGTIKLSDFGIATFINASHVTRTENVVGSVHYLAPELTQGGQATPQSDIYAMGITFFELVTGRLPFDGDSPVNIALKHLNEKFPNIKKFNPDCPDAICKIIYRCCKKSPLERYQSVYDLRNDILKTIANPELMQEKRGFFKRIKAFFSRRKTRRRRRH